MKIPSLVLSLCDDDSNSAVKKHDLQNSLPQVACETTRGSGPAGGSDPTRNSEDRKKKHSNIASIVQEDPNVTRATMGDNNRSHAQYNQSSSLDYIPEYISGCDSDDDTVSTLGSDDLCKKGSNRSIFTDYWKTDTENANEKTSSMQMPNSSLKRSQTYRGYSFYETPESEISSMALSRHADSIMASPDWASYINDELIDRQKQRDSSKHWCSDTGGYETYLKANEDGRTVLPTAALLNDANASRSTHYARQYRNDHANQANLKLNVKVNPKPARRKIFPRKYAEAPTPSSLPSYEYMRSHSQAANARKKANARYRLPALLHNRKLLRSSLRDRSTSVSESIATARTITLEDSLLSSQSRLSVSFETKVTIHEYEKRSEQYIHDGWSERFF